MTDGAPSHGRRWTADYIKVCAEQRAAIGRWVEERLAGGGVADCQICLA